MIPEMLAPLSKPDIVICEQKRFRLLKIKYTLEALSGEKIVYIMPKFDQCALAIGCGGEEMIIGLV